MSYNLIITPAFERNSKPLLKKYKSLKTDLAGLFELLENDPNQGKPLGKDCYKIRLAISSKGKGKSGGARVIPALKSLLIKYTYSPFTTIPTKRIFLTKNFMNC